MNVADSRDYSEAVATARMEATDLNAIYSLILFNNFSKTIPYSYKTNTRRIDGAFSAGTGTLCDSCERIKTSKIKKNGIVDLGHEAMRISISVCYIMFLNVFRIKWNGGLQSRLFRAERQLQLQLHK